ncbi:MAG TPA: EpsI family protein [Terriglobales bacterium]|nr:EpsI family protein [Terriglobales bacterium]
MTSPVLSTARVLLVAAVLLPTAVLLQARGRVEVRPEAADLHTLPLGIAGWQGKDMEISPEIIDTLGKGEFLSRLYVNTTVPPIDLFIAYYNSQRSGDTIHSPKNCLPGSGWTPLQADRVLIPVTSTQSIRVNRYIVARGDARQLVLYWYQAHGRVTASEYTAKLLLVSDSIRMNRSDGGMVRLVTPIPPEETVAQSQARAVDFARALFPMLNNYIPQ